MSVLAAYVSDYDFEDVEGLAMMTLAIATTTAAAAAAAAANYDSDDGHDWLEDLRDTVAFTCRYKKEKPIAEP